MTNYAKGAAGERAYIKLKETQGYLGVRTAGSHSPVDVILFHLIEGVFVCQLKIGAHPPKNPSKEFVDLKLPLEVGKLWVIRKDRKDWSEFGV